MVVVGPDGGATGVTVAQAYRTTGFDQIEVDVRSLGDFARALRAELDTNLLKFKRELDEAFGHGSQFALDPALADMVDKRRTYEIYLNRTRSLFDNLVQGTTRLAAAAEQIGAGYGQADDLAKLAVDDVNAALPTQHVQVTAVSGPE